MLFNSIQFLIFFPLVTALYFLAPYAWRKWVLLVASCWFYMAFVPQYILILLVLIGVDYCAGLAIAGSEGKRRRAWLIASIATNLGMLAWFKYAGFFATNVASLLHVFAIDWQSPLKSIILPIGLSFHTFQSMSYTIEVYRGRVPAERNLALFALYVLFYPQLVAGPIERPQRLLPQLRANHRFDYDRMISGLECMLWGFVKKVVIADRLALIVNQVYGDPHAFSGTALIIATYAFAFQIYCDFSGYTDIAIGAARVMGIDLMKNFDHPYFAASTSDFWKRWHISLSSWFRDYVYIPLGGNRVDRGRWTVNILVVFLLSGIWHGANWTFAVWGALHGFYLIAGRATVGIRERVAEVVGLVAHPRVRRALQVLVTFHLVTFAWIFFRANTLADAWYIVTHLARDVRLSNNGFAAPNTHFSLALAALLAAGLIGFQAIQRRVAARGDVLPRTMAGRWTLSYGLLLALLLFGMFKNPMQFIYFQF